MVCTVVVEKVIPADRDLVFETVPDTTSNWKVFFTGFKPFVGAITHAEIEGGGPVVPGAHRLIDFSDGTHIVELILDHDRPSRHHYKVIEPTKLQGLTMSEIDSNWDFLVEGEGQCRIRWTYSLTPRNFLTVPVVATVGRFGFRGAMRNQLDAIQQYFAERRG
ncbi:MAG: SRPBCC family protein [Acidobacteriota bacterium]